MNQTQYLAFQNTIKTILSVILFILLARLLTIEEFGYYQQIILVIGLLASVFSAGFPIALSYFHGQSGSYQQKVSMYKRFFISQLIIAMCVSILYGLFSSYLMELFENKYLHELYFAIMIIIFSNTSVELFKNLSTVTNKLKSYLIITSTVSAISMIASVIALLYTHNISYLIIILAVFYCITFLMLVRKNLKYFMIIGRKKIVDKIELKYIIAMGSVALISIVNVYIDQLMVSFLLPISDYSDLRIGSFQIPFIGIITGSLLTVMVPKISKYYKEKRYNEIVDLWSHSIEKATILLIPIIVFCIVFAHEIITIFFTDKFIGAVGIFQVYMIQWLRAVVILGAVMGAIGLERELFKNTMFIMFLNIIMNYFLILYMGVIGAAISTTFLNYLALILLIRKIDERLDKKFIHYFPFKIYMISFFASLILSMFLKYSLGGYINSLSAMMLIAIFFYILIIVIQMKLFYNDISISRIKKLL